MVWVFYNLLFILGYALLLPKFLLRMCRRGGYRDGFMERFGVYSETTREAMAGGGRIWFHAVSVGEVHVALGFMAEMRKRDASCSFILSTTTSTGRQVALSRVDERDLVIYFPSDFPFLVNRVVRRLAPRALILTECELWPNIIRACHRAHVPVMLVNGRISDRSYRGYRKVAWATRRILPLMKLLLVQTDTERDRLVDLGALPDTIRVMGSAKYDAVTPPEGGAERAREIMRAAGLGESPRVLLGGSTWAGEEEALLTVFGSIKARVPNLRLVLVPRHMERRAEVERELQGRDVRYVMRSGMASGDASTANDVLVVDTTGELMDFYAAADVIFVGKSLTQHGGQNIIEPAIFGKPIVTGPNLENFPVVRDDFVAGDALLAVRDVAAMEDTLERLVTDDALRAEYGARAAAVVERNRGVVAASVDHVTSIL